MPSAKRRCVPVEDEDEPTLSVQESEPHNRKRVRWDEVHSADVESDVEEPTSSAKATNLVLLAFRSLSDTQICLAALCHSGRIGCAYYDPQKCIIYALEDTQESAHYDVMKLVLEQSDASIVLTSSNSDEEFMDTLRECSEKAGAFFQIRPRREFVPGQGRNRLLSLRLFAALPPEQVKDSQDARSDSTHAKNAYDFMRSRQEVDGDPTQMRWNATIRLSNFASVDSSPLCMASIGALIDHLVRERAVGDIDDEGIAGLDVNDIEIVSPIEAMHINADALFSLQVFENERHASMHFNKTKEGLSLFGILNYTKTALGRSLMRTWLLRPSLSLPVIKARHDAVECFLRPENQVCVDQMRTHLKGIKNMPRILNTMKSGRAKLSDWQDLVKFTFHSAMIWESLRDLHRAIGMPIIQQLVAALDVVRSEDVGAQVNLVIDWEESVNAGRVCVRNGIDEELDNKKHLYYGIDSVLSKVAEQICDTMVQSFTSLNVVYFPQLGFLICIPMLEEWHTTGIQEVDGWSFQSSEHAYFKSQEMYDLDLHIGDLHSMIVDREIEIVQDLLNEVLQSSQAINQACTVYAELDCLLSFAIASRAYNYVRPIMVDDNIIDIKQGRHPLQEQVVDTFIANDFFITGGAGLGTADCTSNSRERKSVMLCTGANASNFVPAESATLGITDKIFTRVSTRESVSKLQSAFMIDLNQVSYALRNCSARSLILMDEFGKGTLATDGAGLFCGVLKHLLNRGSNCPKLLAATHFYDVFHHGFLDPDTLPIAFRHMQIMLTPRAGSSFKDNDTSTSVCLEVAEGLSLESHAAKCAEIFGIPSRVVQRAQYVSQLISVHDLGRLHDEEMSEEEKTDLGDAEAVCRRFLAWDLEEKDGLGEGGVKAKLAEVLGRSSQ
ncbi:hypothetical protein M378DRAFT_187097 [Amanita muscaria Koide BX008]|uniref:DNA mismatch repair proteins mutS family domain-containing protein n=1 Tax=Amanita muscaria (strain Koide BX008) TaxID=946122 RepID=A0A0C2SJ60_AMAMK|nr:hypothetical protein M378DRAFT_187097 [Amanita muscaria Koide BX008]